MFVTHEPFKFPIQFAGGSTTWHLVELMVTTPWLLLTFEDQEEDVARTFFLNGTDTLLQLLVNPTLGRTTGVQLVLPPRWSPTLDWSLVRVRRIKRELRSIDGAIPSAVLTTADGQRYGGYPIERTVRDDSDLALVVELPLAAA